MRLLPTLILAVVLLLGAAADAQLRVVATVPDLGSLTEAVGGDAVDVTVLVKGPQDPHFVEARPSFIRALHRADLLVLQGLELELGWVPVLLQSARNRDVMPGGSGYLDASTAIAPLQVPTAPVDRSMGDVHPYGNPHYLTDPVNGLRVAALLRDRLAQLEPAAAEDFARRYEAFANRLVGALVGPALVERHGADAVVRAIESGTLAEFAGSDGVDGWLGRLSQPRKAVEDHRLWPYFARRFGLTLIGTLEPLPGVAPTTRHLGRVVELMDAQDVKLVLASPYFDPRYARSVAERTGAHVAEMAHQVGAREGTGDYVALIAYNVRQVLKE